MWDATVNFLESVATHFLTKIEKILNMKILKKRKFPFIRYENAFSG